MNTLDKSYRYLLEDIIYNGTEKQTRNGKTVSVFGVQIRHDMQTGFPLLTTKQIYFKGVVTELLWFLRGDTNIKYLVDNHCNIWTGDAYKNYLQSNKSPIISLESFAERIKSDADFAQQWGELGPIYGKQWRRWESKVADKLGAQSPMSYFTEVDQIINIIDDLKTNPDSRRMVVSAWNVGELDQMVLPPCHHGFQVYTRELDFEERERLYLGLGETWDGPFTEDIGDKFKIPKRGISLMWNQRSVDTFLGLPFNIASYGLLLEMMAKEVGMMPDKLIGNLGDTHLYVDHISQAEEQMNRSPFSLPDLSINECSFNPVKLNYTLHDYECHPPIKAPLLN